MTVEIVRARTIDAPPIEPRRSTLLDVASVSEGLAWLTGTDLFESLNCLQARFWDPACGASQSAKTFDGPTWVDGAKFAAYTGVKCDPIGMGELDNLTNGLFTNIESRGVEQAVMERIFGASAITPLTDAATVALGVAMLEGEAAQKYAGQPTLHLTAAAASLLSQRGALEWDGNILRTALGSKVVVGAGYSVSNQGPAAAAGTATTDWLWASGEIVIARGEVKSFQELNRTNNDNRILVERDYVVGVDCFLAAVEVTLA